MDYIVTAEQMDAFMSKMIKKYNIEINILYFNDDRYANITGTVYLYKDGAPLGRAHGYDFYFKYNKWTDKLTYDGMFPGKIGVKPFGYLPEDLVREYFSKKVHDVLKEHIDKGYTYLPRNK